MPVWTDIASQADNLRSVIEKHASASRPDMERAARLLKGAGRITYPAWGLD